ncbi:hypothetical protein F4801DRAFT_539154 [Xylaria longipes]|nr:hypothetical protein F4801DRAFT_539154 [Xylaria longipes]
MARKGNIKVRTGCLTCKIRKVKCDEGKPHCRRCTRTGRKCDGYTPTRTTSSALSWHRPRHLFPDVNSASERRCLEFFCEVAAPVMSGPLDPYFWTHLILQFCQMEPAVRHSVVAVGSLYEQIRRHEDMDPLLRNDNLVLSHYNAAIRHLKTMKNESLVLLVCVLFICIEFLRGNQGAATKHCQHGISILKRVEEAFPWAKEYLSPIFRRLSLVPFFFSPIDLAQPNIPCLDDTNPSFSAVDRSQPNQICLDDAIPSFSSFGNAQFYLDGIVSRTVRLIRLGDVYRLGYMIHEAVSPDLIAEQDLTRTLLDDWHSNFVQLVKKSSQPVSTSVYRCNMLMRYLICRVWVETPFDFYQTAYDEHNGLFRSIVDSAAAVESLNYSAKPIKFTFEMGYIPLLYFVVMKCRCLETRLRALLLMRRLGAARENLWEMVTMFASAKRIVEIEHGAILTDDGNLSTEPSHPGLPPDEVRVRDAATEPQPLVQMVDGVERVGRQGGFFMRTADDRIYVQSEFLPQPSWA